MNPVHFSKRKKNQPEMLLRCKTQAQKEKKTRLKSNTEKWEKSCSFSTTFIASAKSFTPHSF